MNYKLVWTLKKQGTMFYINLFHTMHKIFYLHLFRPEFVYIRDQRNECVLATSQQLKLDIMAS
jgi:hypothetical protein